MKSARVRSERGRQQGGQKLVVLCRSNGRSSRVRCALPALWPWHALPSRRPGEPLDLALGSDMLQYMTETMAGLDWQKELVAHGSLAQFHF